MPTIDVRADTSQATSSMNAFAAALQATNDRIEKVTKSTANFNKDGEQTSATIKGMTKDGQEFTATFKRVADQIDAATGKVLTWKTELSKLNYSTIKKDTDDLIHKTTALDQVIARVARSFQYFITYRAFNFITNQIEDGIKAAKDFQIQLSLIRTISQDTQLSFAQYGNAVRKVSDDSGIDVNEVGKAFYDTVSNQIAKGSDTGAFVKTATDLSRVTGSTLPDSVNLLSSAINAYGLSVSDAERLSAIFFKTIDEGRIVASELSNTFGRVGVLGANLGVSIEELNAVLAITTQKGFKTSDAMTLLTNLLIKLEKPTEATKEFFQGLGVDTGEAAVKLLGFNGVLKRMVDLVKSGQVDVSAFFDEIRGRKQFGIFEQSIDQISDFSDRLKDTTAVMKTYRTALEIRGESPADKLVKETNKLSNVFKVDLGQAILKNVADLATWIGGADTVVGAAGKLGDTIKLVGISLGIYAAASVTARTANTLLTASFYSAAGGAGTLLRTLIPLAAGYATYVAAKNLIGGDQGDIFGKIDPTRLDSLSASIEKAALKMKDFKENATKIDVFAEGTKRVDDRFKDLIGTLAKANLANDKLLNSARDKSKEAADALKIGFAGFADTLKKNINDIKSKITEARNEIEKSAKFVAGFGDTIDDIIYKSQTKFATDEQKIELSEIRIAKIIDKIKELYASGDNQKIEEARQLAKEAASLIAAAEEGRNDLQRKYLEEDLKSGRTPRDPSGVDVFTASTTNEQQRLYNLKALITALEERGAKAQATKVENLQRETAAETEKLRILEQALKAYEKIDVFNKEGGVKGDYKTQGRFDPAKLQAELDKLDKQILEGAGGNADKQFQLVVLLSEKRRALIAEAAAAERAEFLKTAQQRALGEQEAFKQRIENIKKERDVLLGKQTAGLGALGDANVAALSGFSNNLFGGKGVLDLKGENKAAATDLAFQIGEYKKLVESANANKVNKDGVLVADPNILKAAGDQYERIVKLLLQYRDKLSPGTDLSISDSAGKLVTPGNSVAGVQQQIDDLIKNANAIFANVTQQKTEGGLLDLQLGGPLAELKKQFPELSSTADSAAKTMNQSFLDFANGGLKAVEDRLREIQRLSAPGGPGKQQSVGDFGGGEVYAATGGLVGAFPGQPRGLDQYPIWAAKDEFIVNAASSRMFRPMLEAINNRQYPRYMERGGVVGDTNIGDINVSVNGSSTPDATGRGIARSLERELRRNTIYLKRK